MVFYFFPLALLHQICVKSDNFIFSIIIINLNTEMVFSADSWVLFTGE